MASVALIWCRHCGVGFAIAPPPPVCPNEQCRKVADWAPESLTPRTAYRLSITDMRFLRSHKIDPVR